MRKSSGKSEGPRIQDWAASIYQLRRHLDLSQTAFGQQLHFSAMAISRWERGTQEPTAESYINLGNLAGDPLCWYFWARAGLRSEDLMRVMPALRQRLNRANIAKFQIVSAGAGVRKSKIPQLVAVPLLKDVTASHGGKGEGSSTLHDAPMESMIAAPNDWCPNPSTTACVRVRGNCMAPLIYDGYILAVDSSQHDHAKLDGEIVVAWHRDMGLTVSRLKRYGSTEVLQPENRDYEPIVMDGKQKWNVLAKVLWWIGNA
jgi:SOS-response transcriptional repressor LexA